MVILQYTPFMCLPILLLIYSGFTLRRANDGPKFPINVGLTTLNRYYLELINIKHMLI